MILTTIDNVTTKEYFFSTNHIQQCKSKIKLSDEWVPITYYLPMYIVPRKGFEDGTIRTKEDLIKFNDMYEYKLIDNPDPLFQF